MSAEIYSVMDISSSGAFHSSSHTGNGTFRVRSHALVLCTLEPRTLYAQVGESYVSHSGGFKFTRVVQTYKGFRDSRGHGTNTTQHFYIKIIYPFTFRGRSLSLCSLFCCKIEHPNGKETTVDWGYQGITAITSDSVSLNAPLKGKCSTCPLMFRWRRKRFDIVY